MPNSEPNATDVAEPALWAAELLRIDVLRADAVPPRHAVYSPPDEDDDPTVLVISDDQSPEDEAAAIMHGIQRGHLGYADN